MLRIGRQIRLRPAAILVLHWKESGSRRRKWIRPVVFQTVRNVIAQARAAPARENKAATKPAAESEPAKASLLRWRRRGVVHGASDPLLCPCCHVQMQLTDFILKEPGVRSLPVILDQVS